MKEKMIRKMDELGRIVIPQDFRNALSWTAESKITMVRQDNQLILQADTDCCSLCGSEETLMQIKEKQICNAYVLEITKIDKSKNCFYFRLYTIVPD